MTTTGAIVLAVVLLGATAFGLWRRRTDGRVRSVAQDPSGPVRLTADEVGAPLGDRATLVQFSTAFCQPCRATRRILDDVAAMVDGVRHVDVDAESHLELVRRLGIQRTPTVLVLDAEGAVVRRAAGLPRKVDVLAALPLEPSGHDAG